MLAGAAAALLAAPAAAQAATTQVWMGTPPSAQKKFEKLVGDADAFFPSVTNIRVGDRVRFVPVGFHDIDFPAKDGSAIALARGRPGHVALPLPRRDAHVRGDDRDLPGAKARAGMIAAAALAAVSIGYAAYTPKHLDIVAGDTVHWTQDSVRKHSVTAYDGSFDSGPLLTGETYERTYPALGTYGYYCRLHAGIVGEVQVHSVVLDPVDAPASAGRPYPLHGRAAPGTRSVTVTGDDGS